jgi:hypothetical protein
MSTSIGIVKKASFCLSNSSLIMLYYSLVYSYMQYCILVWGSMYPSNLYCIIVLLQKRIRDQSLLMPGRGPEEILRGHQKFLTSEGGGGRKYFEHEGGGGKIKSME